MVWSSGKIAERSSMSWFNRSKGYGVHQRKMAARSILAVEKAGLISILIDDWRRKG